MKASWLSVLLFALLRCSGGTCAADHPCGSGEQCLYKIGSCTAAGVCMAKESGPQCDAIELVCGCGTNGETGCGFPEGYASAPSTGANTCTTTR